MLNSTENMYTNAKSILGIIAVVATSLIVALDLIHNELNNKISFEEPEKRKSKKKQKK